MKRSKWRVGGCGGRGGGRGGGGGGVGSFKTVADSRTKRSLSSFFIKRETRSKFRPSKGRVNRPFYSCLLGDLAFEWQRRWR